MFTIIIYKLSRTIAWLLTAIFFATPVVADDQGVLVTMATTYGNITIELYPDKAPVTVENFLRYVDAGHFDGSSFYRTVRYDNDKGNPKIEVIQGAVD